MTMARAQIEQHTEYGAVIALSSGDIEARIAPNVGSNLFSLKVNGTELIHVHPDRPLRVGDFTGNFCIYPVPNRVRDSVFEFEGTKCSFVGLVPPRGNPVLVHGLVRALTWEHDEPIITSDEATVVTRLRWDRSQPEFERYPFENMLEHKYVVTMTGVTVEYTAKNLGSKRMPYGYALHPSFKRLSRDTRISLPARKVLEMDAELLPTWEMLDVEGHENLNLNESRLLTDLDLDHIYTELTGSPYIEHPEQGLRITIKSSEDFRFAVIHTRDRETVEIEPQTCSTDAFNAPDPAAAGLLILEPGASRTGAISYSIG
jgi:aldose 1-epimerase